MEPHSIYSAQLIKDRIFLPGPVISFVGRSPIVNAGFEPYINLFTPQQWDTNMARFQQLNRFNPNVLRFIRSYTSGARKCSVHDKSIRIPKMLVDHGGLETELILVSVRGGFQIYSKQNYLKSKGIINPDFEFHEGGPDYTKGLIYPEKTLYIPEVPKVILAGINHSLLELVKKDNSLLFKISPREFEQLIADMLLSQGYQVSLTKATCDGGVDIYAAINNILGSFLYLVDCKQYSTGRNVGVSAVRQLYGNVEVKQANAGILITTSHFSKPAMQFCHQAKHRMSLLDHEVLIKWLKMI